MRNNGSLMQRHRGSQLVLREVGVWHDGQDGAFLAVDVPVAEEGDAEGADVKPGAGGRVVVGYCPGLEDCFLGWGELSVRGLVLRSGLVPEGVIGEEDVQRLWLADEVIAARGEWQGGVSCVGVAADGGETGWEDDPAVLD
jgi:hypothetical protein